MKTKKVRFYRAVVFLLLLLFINIELPYSDRSLIQLMVPPFKIGGMQLYLGGIIFLIGVVVLGNEIHKSGYLNIRSKWVVICFILMGSSIIYQGANLLSRPVYLMHQGLKCVEMKESRLDLVSINGEDFIEAEMVMFCHRHMKTPVRVAIELDDGLSPYIQECYLEVEENLLLSSEMDEVVRVQIPVVLKESYATNEAFFYQFHEQDYKILISDKEGEVTYLRTDLY